jgi:xanthine dehydrogenase accessory factor
VLELAGALLGAIDAGRRLAVATVIAVDGSAPRALGTSMAVDDEGRVIGSISGGCVEGSVYDACSRVLDTGESEVCDFGFSDDDAFAVGLSCGGRLRVHIREFAPKGARNAIDDALRAEFGRARDGEGAGVALVFAEPAGADVLLVASHAGAAGQERVIAELGAALRAGRSVTRRVECEGVLRETVLLVSATPPRLIVFGAVDFSAALSRAALLLGYRVTVCDARPVFASPERFPGAEVVTRWPTDYLAGTEVDERTVVCILTHDDKFDVPLIEAALQLPVAYVGAMGSRITHERRVRNLRERGVSDQALATLRSPIGLDLGASSPEETAVSILAEVLAVKTGASAQPLTGTSGAIHRVARVEATSSQGSLE